MSAPHSHAPPVQATAASSSLPTAVPSSSRNPHGTHPDFLTSPQIPPRTSSNRSHHRNSGTASASRRQEEEGHRNLKDRSANCRDKTENIRPVQNGDQPLEIPSAGLDENTSHARMSSPPTAQHHPEGTMETIPSLGTLVKESSTVINQVVVSDPAVLIEREHARQAGAQPATPEGNVRTTTGTEAVGHDDGGRAGTRSRHDYSGAAARRKETTFGHYILGQTLGEGEFGKVKLGLKRDGSIQVAIKLIRREVLGSNPNRLPKIYREISILRGLSHPNIVRLHEMVETDRHIGIIMEYASGGELFDYILNNRYLRDNAARRLFAQLVSGVGYLHKKGIVHRDLKLENLLLDRNRNIIITDFGFANTFDPADELDEEIEYNLTNKDYVRRLQLDRPNARGMRRGDLMQTSCGSPCYAAPELVVSDSLYTGRKVDVWSCGVILYAMLAGYLPFDDDPANPDGDNINLLYKYIVTTSLTFPEYVTPHARDLLRRILVPDPRKRADLFEVARHSWLSEYSHIVSHITSSTTKVTDITDTTVPSDNGFDGPALTRSASVKEAPRTYMSGVPAVGGFGHEDVLHDLPPEKSRTPREAKRRTVQVEYVAPQSQTARGASVSGAIPSSSNQPGAVPSRAGSNRRTALANTQARVSLPQGATAMQPVSGDGGYPKAATGTAADITTSTSGGLSRTISDTAAVSGTPAPHAGPQGTRPTTGGSMASFNAGRLSASYGQPVAPKVEATNAQARLAQPNSKHNVISPPASRSSVQPSVGVLSTQQQLPAKFNTTPRQEPPKGHKRSSTVSSIGEKLFSRSGSIFGGNRNSQTNGSRRAGRRYPPSTSVREPSATQGGRMSTDSRRSGQYPSNRKHSGSVTQSKPRRFSLLPPSFSFRAFASPTKPQTPDEESQAAAAPAGGANPPQRQGSNVSQGQNRHRADSHGVQDGMGMVVEGPGEDPVVEEEPVNYHTRIDQQFAELDTRHAAQGSQSTEQENQDPSMGHRHANRFSPSYYDGVQGAYEAPPRQSVNPGRSGRGTALQNHRKFTDAYEYERTPSRNSGSSGAAKKVMDFFRRRAKSRVGEDR